jgi:hypothetical protein
MSEQRALIPIGITGTITSPGDRQGWSVKVEDDAGNTGGFLILEWNESLGESYDSWVANSADLQPFFRESGWVVCWT